MRSAAVKSAVFAAEKLIQRRRQQRCTRLRRVGARPRRRTQVEDMYEQQGPLYFRRAYRMMYRSFNKLARKLHNGILKASGKNHFAGRNYRYVPNGPITTSVRLACALRYFVGGSIIIVSTKQMWMFHLLMRLTSWRLRCKEASPLKLQEWVILRLFQGNSSAAAIIFMTWTVFSVAGESATTGFKLNIHIISCPEIACMPSLLKPTCAVQLPFLVVDTHGPLLAVKTNT